MPCGWPAAGSGRCAVGSMLHVFDGFRVIDVDTGSATIHARAGGQGPPVLLLHGHPRTHATWHRIAPLLAARHTVVCADLRGYGHSSTPTPTADHSTYSKRAMADDCVALMRTLGHERFDVVGHDRGSYVAFRLAMDHPDTVRSIVVMDSVPIGEALRRCDARFARVWWHWFFLGNPVAGAERVINSDPDAWYRSDEQRSRMGDEAWEDFHNAIHNPDVVRAMCEDYRSGLTVDRQHDDQDQANGRRIMCPLLVLWSTHDDMETLYDDPVAVWRSWARDVRGHAIESGHHMAEEAPQDVAASLLAFLGT
jgi:haloacetate dehalogenase